MNNRSEPPHPNHFLGLYISGKTNDSNPVFVTTILLVLTVPYGILSTSDTLSFTNPYVTELRQMKLSLTSLKRPGFVLTQKHVNSNQLD